MRTSTTPKNSNDNVNHRGFTSLRRRLRGFINGSMKFFCRFASTSSTDTKNRPSTTIQFSSPVLSTRLFDLPNELQLRILNCLPPDVVIKKRIVCKKWNRLIVKNKSQLQRFPISVTLRYDEELQAWCLERDDDRWTNTVRQQTVDNIRNVFVKDGQLYFQRILLKDSPKRFDSSFFDWLSYCKIISFRIDGTNENSPENLALTATVFQSLTDTVFQSLTDTVFSSLINFFQYHRPHIEPRNFAVLNVATAQVSSIIQHEFLKCFIWKSLESFYMIKVADQLANAVTHSVFSMGIPNNLNTFDVTQCNLNDKNIIALAKNLLNRVIIGEGNLFIRFDQPVFLLCQLRDVISKWCRKPKVSFFRYLQFAITDFTLADLIRECRRHFIPVDGNRIRHPFETIYSIALHETVLSERNRRISLQLETRQKHIKPENVVVEHMHSRECVREMAFPSPFTTKKIQLTNRSGHCVAFNIRSNCKNVTTSADYAVVADVKVVDVGYEGVPNHCCRFAQCQLFIEWITVSPLPFIHFDPAWFKDSTRIAMKCFPIFLVN